MSDPIMEQDLSEGANTLTSLPVSEGSLTVTVDAASEATSETDISLLLFENESTSALAPAVNHDPESVAPSATEAEGVPAASQPLSDNESAMTVAPTVNEGSDAIAPSEAETEYEVSLEPTADVELEPSKMFTVFPKLPFELREQIWKSAIVPRLVHWRPGGGKPPAILHVCSESRAATNKAYERVELKYLRHRTYGLFINYNLDVLYRKQRLPYPAVEPGSLPRRLITPEWSKPIKRIAMNLDRAAEGFRLSPQLPGWRFKTPSLWRKFKALFPDLEEIVVILYPKLERGNKFEELIEVDNEDIERETIKDDVQQRQPLMMDMIRPSLLEREKRGLGGPLKLTFMRIPVERRRRLCESCGHVVHSPRYRGHGSPPDHF
jgi:hypothetical protein